MFGKTIKAECKTKTCSNYKKSLIVDLMKPCCDLCYNDLMITDSDHMLHKRKEALAYRALAIKEGRL